MKYKYFLTVVISFVSISAFSNTQQVAIEQPQIKLENLEKMFDGKIGVYAIDTNNNKIFAYHANDRFPVQSTFKLIGVSALLNLCHKNKNVLQEKIHYTKDDLVFWHPVTGKYVTDGMTLKALSEAAISYSDNTAINLIMKRIGGAQSIANFARAIGNNTFNVEHYESELNSNPKDKHDTSTPKDMAVSLQKLTLGNILIQPQRKQLVAWMKNNTTGYKKIRAGVPHGWVVADKTAGGSYGISNDLGIMWSPVCRPIVLAIYTVRNKHDAKGRDDIVASTTNIVLNEFAKTNPCFAATGMTLPEA